jgi:DNA-binding transcriptional ArsR family regulator
MIDPTRLEILHLLERLSELAPDVRFGQLIANLSYLAVGPTNEAIWDMEDESLLEAIRQQLGDFSERQIKVRSLEVADSNPL